MKRLSLMGLLVLATVCPVGAAVVLEDDFNDGVLDPGWTATLNDTSGWSYTESGTTLQVDDIVKPSNPLGPWSGVTLARPTSSALGDFHVDFDISWTTNSAALQKVLLALRDVNGNLIVEAGYVDDILAVNGTAQVRIGSGDVAVFYAVHWGTTQNINFSFDRIGDAVSVSVFNPGDGQDRLLLTGTSTAPLQAVELTFARGTASLGQFYTESVDLIRVVPEPATASLFAFGVLALVRRTRLGA